MTRAARNARQLVIVTAATFVSLVALATPAAACLSSGPHGDVVFTGVVVERRPANAWSALRLALNRDDDLYNAEYVMAVESVERGGPIASSPFGVSMVTIDGCREEMEVGSRYRVFVERHGRDWTLEFGSAERLDEPAGPMPSVSPGVSGWLIPPLGIALVIAAPFVLNRWIGRGRRTVRDDRP